MSSRQFIIFIIFLPKFLQAQSLAKHLDKYYSCKNKAELAIIDSDYTEALTQYKLAFTYKTANARDLYNASRLSLLLNDTATARNYITDLILHGLESRILQNFYGGQLTASHSLYSYIMKDYDSLSGRYKHSDLARNGDLLVSILNRDQEIRKNSVSKEETALSDKRNVDSLIAFIKKHGFPSFDNVGFADPFAGIGIGGTFYMIYWHSRFDDNRLDSIGLKAVLNGEYPPDEFAEVFDLKYYPSKYQMLVPGLAEMDRELEHLPIDSVNRNRAKLYMERQEYYKKKLLFMRTQKPHYFSFLLVPQVIYGMNFAKMEKPKK